MESTYRQKLSVREPFKRAAAALARAILKGDFHGSALPDDECRCRMVSITISQRPTHYGLCGGGGNVAGTRLVMYILQHLLLLHGWKFFAVAESSGAEEHLISTAHANRN